MLTRLEPYGWYNVHRKHSSNTVTVQGGRECTAHLRSHIPPVRLLCQHPATIWLRLPSAQAHGMVCSGKWQRKTSTSSIKPGGISASKLKELPRGRPVESRPSRHSQINPVIYQWKSMEASWADLTEYHKFGGLDRIFSSHSPRDQKSEIRTLQGLTLPRGSRKDLLCFFQLWVAVSFHGLWPYTLVSAFFFRLSVSNLPASHWI